MPTALAIIGIILASMISGAVILSIWYMKMMAKPGQLEDYLKAMHDANPHRWHCHLEKEFCTCGELIKERSSAQNAHT